MRPARCAKAILAIPCIGGAAIGKTFKEYVDEGFLVAGSPDQVTEQMEHLIKSLKSKGKGAIILPHGVLFRGNKEADIRRNLVDRGLINLAVIGMLSSASGVYYYRLESGGKTEIKKMVLLSGRGEKEAEVCENIVMESAESWTIVRASWFNQNFSVGYLLDSVLTGEVALPAGPVPEPFIDADDPLVVVGAGPDHADPQARARD